MTSVSAQLPTSAQDHCKSVIPLELDKEALLKMPISTYKNADDTYTVLSRYEDNVWKIEGSRFSAGTQKQNKTFDFAKVPNEFVAPLKFALKRYDIKYSPAGNTWRNKFHYSNYFLKYLKSIKVSSLKGLPPMLFENYVQHITNKISMQGGQLSTSSKLQHFEAVEWLYINLRGTEWAFPHPWPESSSSHLSGNTGNTGKRTSTNNPIDNATLKIVIPICQDLIAETPKLVSIKEEVASLTQGLILDGAPEAEIAKNIKNAYNRHGFKGEYDFKSKYLEVITATTIVTLCFSGIRFSELAAIETNPIREEIRDGDTYFWLRSYSYKTKVGSTEWMVPEIVKSALAAAQLLTEPCRKEFAAKVSASPAGLEPTQPSELEKRIYLLPTKSGPTEITTASINQQFRKFTQKHGLPHFTTHQFRRTFAVHVAEASYGDLRYLKEHFKHWSMDMTLLYAANDEQSVELYDEIAIEIKNKRFKVLEMVLQEGTTLAGGLAAGIASFRAKNVPIKHFKDTKEMVESISSTIQIWPTGHSWCTNNSAGCGGRSAIHPTRCIRCPESIIEKERHGEVYKRLHEQNLELLNNKEIGPAGQARARRDVEDCELVLSALGLAPE